MQTLRELELRVGLYSFADAQTNLDRIAALREECAQKTDGSRSARIGFAA